MEMITLVYLDLKGGQGILGLWSFGLTILSVASLLAKQKKFSMSNWNELKSLQGACF